MTVRKFVFALLVALFLVGLAQPQPADALRLAGRVRLTCTGIEGNGALVTMTRDNTGNGIERYRVVVTDANGNTLFQVSGAFNVRTRLRLGNATYQAAPTANTIRMVIISESGNGYLETVMATVTGRCNNLGQAIPNQGGGSASPLVYDIGKFVLRTITCNTGIYDVPGGGQVPGALIKAGQTWYVSPTPELSRSGQSFTAINIGQKIGFVPTSCVG
jgi:hypothetical protein